MLTRDEILARKPKVTKIRVDFWDAEVGVCSITSAQRDDFMALCREAKTSEKYASATAYLIACSLCGDNGALLFDPCNVGDLNLIRGWSGALTDILSELSMKASGVQKDSVDEARKNSESAPKKDSGIV